MNRLSLSPVRRHRGDDYADVDDAEEHKLQKQQQTSANDADADAKNSKSIRRMRYVL